MECALSEVVPRVPGTVEGPASCVQQDTADAIRILGPLLFATCKSKIDRPGLSLYQ